MQIYYFLLTIYFILFVILAWRRLEWAIYLIVFSLPTYLIRFNLLGLPMTLLEAMIILLFLVWLIKNIKIQEYKNIKIKFGGDLFLYSCIFIFLLAATIAMFVGPELRTAAGIWKAYFIEPILFLIVVVTTIKKGGLKKVFQFLGFSVLVLSLVAIYQKITGDLIPNPFWAAEATRRVMGVFEYPNALALFMAPVLVMLTGFVATRIQEYKNIKTPASPAGGQEYKNKIINKDSLLLFYYFIILFLGLVAVYFTKSKGAIIGILAGIIFYAICFKGYRKYFAGVLGAIIIFIFLYSCIFNLPMDLKGMTTVKGGDSISTRIDMWDETWEMLKTRPILGAGLAGYQPAMAPFHDKQYIEIYLYPHNWVLNFWTEIGLIGLMGLIGILGWFYVTGFKIVRKQSSNGAMEQCDPVFNCSIVQLLMAGMTTLLVHGLVDAPYFKNDLSVLFWLIIGGVIILVRPAEPAG